MSNSKRQSLIVIGFGLIVIAGILLYFALSSPRVSDTSALSRTLTASSASYQSENANNINSQKASDAVQYPVNINTCTVDDLITISGIGEVKASAIIEYRELIGGYTSVEQIKNIRGIGDSVYEKISPYLCV